MSREQDSRRKAKESARVAERGDIRREELVGERNRRECKNAINIAYIQRALKQGEFHVQKIL